MIKICFVSWHYQNTRVFLDTIIKMTPGLSGKWKNIEAVLDPNQADYVAIFDGSNDNIPNADRKAIYFGQHPNCLPSFRKWEGLPALLKFDLGAYVNPGEWWITNSYDQLMALQPPIKNNRLLCVCTGHTHTPMYRQRLTFLEEYCTKHKDLVLYGRPQENYVTRTKLLPYYKGALGNKHPDGTKGEHLVGKEEVLLNSRYSLEFDVGPTINYFSERFYDALLLWAMPIYFGSNNVHNFMPAGSFRYFDQANLNDVNEVHNIANSNIREDNLGIITHARDLLLNKYQMWAMVHHVVNNIGDYRRDQLATYNAWIAN